MKMKRDTKIRAYVLSLLTGIMIILPGKAVYSQIDRQQGGSEVFIDRRNKENIAGRAEIAFAIGERFDLPQNLMWGVVNLKEAMNRWTDVTTDLTQHLMLSDQRIMNVPFLFVSTDKVFDLSETEKQNLRMYFQNGGFMFLDNAEPRTDFSASGAALQKLLRDVIPNVRFASIPNSHGIYHSYFDFTDGPPQGAEVGLVPTATPDIVIRSRDRFYLEGAWYNNELVAVYSDKGYILKWNETSNNEPQLRMGVNLIVYALTKTNSIAKQTIR